jgi:NSS family neurotransmitter:Na+ symporter
MSELNTQSWTGKLGFVLASVGAAVGLGAIWKFPYMAGAGGGAAFLLPFVFFSFTLGFGLLLAEISLGKAGKGGIVTAYKQLGGPVWGVIGYLGIIIGFVLLSFYSVVGGWCLLYFFVALKGFASTTPDALGQLFGQLSSSPWIASAAQIGFLVMCAAVVGSGIRNGIEKSSKWLMPLLFVFILVLIGTGMSQPGAWKGVEYLFYPDFSKFSFKVLLDAMGLTFFSYSVGAGCMLTYGAYIDDKTKLLSSTFWIIALSLLVSILAGLMILPASFAFGMDPAAGPGLTFITMPAIFAQLPFGTLFAVIFFFCLIIAALTSAVSMLEIDITWMVQELHISRVRSVIICTLLMLFLSIPCALSFGVMADFKIFGKTVFDLSDFMVSNIMLPIGGILSAILAAWFAWGKVHGSWSSEADYPFWKKFLRIMIGIFCPALVLAVMISGLVS